MFKLPTSNVQNVISTVSLFSGGAFLNFSQAKAQTDLLFLNGYAAWIKKK